MRATTNKSANGRLAARAAAAPARAKAAVSRTTKKVATKTKKAAPKKAAPKKAAPKKAAPKKVASKKVATKASKSTPKKAATKKASAKKVATKASKSSPKKATPKKVATKASKSSPKKATPQKATPRVSRQRIESQPMTPSSRAPERAPLTPLVRTASSGVGSSGVIARGPSDRELRAGDDLPPLARRAVTRVDIARYCAASGDFNLIALDEPRARDAGLPGVVVPGGLAFALADACVAAWLGREGRVGKSGARLVKMVWPDDELVAHARVSDVRSAASGREVELDVWVENQKGELVLRGQSTCVLDGVASSAGQ